jgi:hypothetical protein
MTCGNFLMGDIIYNSDSILEFKYEIFGTDTIKKIELISNNKVIKTNFTSKLSISSSFFVKDTTSISYFYIRAIQNDGEMVWTSPIYIIKNKGLTSIEKNNNSKIFCYPNPTSGTIWIRCSTQLSLTQYSIIDLYGKKVLSGTLPINTYNQSSIDISSIPKGIYLLQLNGPDIFKTIKVSKN